MSVVLCTPQSKRQNCVNLFLRKAYDIQLYGILTCIRSGFTYVLGFPSPKFVPTYSLALVTDIVGQFFIFNHSKKFHSILHSNSSFGIHSDVLMYLPDGNIAQYIWHHPSTHPYGQPIIPQCATCFAVVRKFDAKEKGASVEQTCPRCRSTRKILRPKGLLPVFGKKYSGTAGSDGLWFVKWLTVEKSLAPIYPYNAQTQK